MQKIEGYVLQDEKEGVNYRRIYMDKASANIAITERYEKVDIDAGRVKIVPISIVSYIDLKQDVKVKDQCPQCGGLGKVKKTKTIVEESKVEEIEEKKSLFKKFKKSKKEEEKVEKVKPVEKVIVEMVICPVCEGKKEIWKDTKAIVIY